MGIGGSYMSWFRRKTELFGFKLLLPRIENELENEIWQVWSTGGNYSC